MNRWITLFAAGMALLAAAGSAFVGVSLERSQKSTEASIASLQERLRATERRMRQTAEPAEPAESTEPGEPAESTINVAGSAPEKTPVPPPARDTQILTNALRDVLVTFDQCTLATRTLRCTYTVTNQSGAEKKFILGIGGTNSRFENDRGGASVFDDVGNDFLSVGGGIANHALADCDSYSTCEIEKILTPRVRTAGWLRFDNVDPEASVVKLLRLKWSDGNVWVPMDFRLIPIIRPGES